MWLQSDPKALIRSMAHFPLNFDMKSVPMIRPMSKQHLNKSKIQRKKNVSGKRCWLIWWVIFRYDSSSNWHRTSVLLINLLWVGSADQRETDTSWSSYSFSRETWDRQTDRLSCIRVVTSWFLQPKRCSFLIKLVLISSISNQHGSCQLADVLVKRTLTQPHNNITMTLNVVWWCLYLENLQIYTLF